MAALLGVWERLALPFQQGGRGGLSYLLKEEVLSDGEVSGEERTREQVSESV